MANTGIYFDRVWKKFKRGDHVDVLHDAIALMLRRAIVGSEQRFINNEPSPSNATTLRCGNPNAMPRAIDEHKPKVRTRKLPSLG